MPRFRQYRVYPWDEEFGFSPGFYNMGPPEPDPEHGGYIEPAELGLVPATKPGETIVHIAPGDQLPVNLEAMWEMAMAGQVTGIYVPRAPWEIDSFTYTEGFASKKAAREAAQGFTQPPAKGHKASFYGYVQIVSLREQPRQCVVDWAGIVAHYSRPKR